MVELDCNCINIGCEIMQVVLLWCELAHFFIDLNITLEFF